MIADRFTPGVSLVAKFPDAAARPEQASSRSVPAQWSDMEQNGHMRTTAYLAAAEDVRMQFFDAAGFSMAAFARRGFGPVIQSDDLRYSAELRLLDTALGDLRLAGLSTDGARFQMRNTFTRLDGRPASTVTSTGGWLDLARSAKETDPTACRPVRRSRSDGPYRRLPGRGIAGLTLMIELARATNAGRFPSNVQPPRVPPTSSKPKERKP